MSSTSKRYAPEVRERAVRLVLEHQREHESQWAAIVSVASMIGCTPETLRIWVRRSEVDEGRRPGITSDERARLKELERENRELRRANEILKSASLSSRPSSTVEQGSDCLHRQAPRRVRGRADLRGVAVRPADLLRGQGQAALGAGAA
jgi:transposase